MKTKTKRLWMTAILASLFMAAFIGGCKKDTYVEIPGVCPLVASTNPLNAATHVPLNQIITATFNEKMDPATITQASFTLQGETNVSGTLTYDATNAMISFVPSTPLAPSTTYTGTVKSSIKDLNGNALQTNYSWTFSTGAVLSPTVVSTDPANNAIGVFLNQVVSATFSEPMDPLTITQATFTIKQGTTSVAGIISYSGITATFNPPSGALKSNTIYTCTISTGAKNIAGTPLENDYVWTFTTGSLVGPSVIFTDPTNKETGVGLDKIITATFSMPMDPLTITSTTFTLKQGLLSVVGIVTYTGTTASFKPSSALMANTIYTGIITTGAKNVAGTPMANDYVWTFTTGGTLTAPTVITTDPANKATGVVLNKIVTATFSMPMDPLTLTTTTFTLKQGLTSVAGTVSYFGTTAFFNPSSALIANTIYTCTITTGAKNVAGTPLANDYVWTFTTGTVTAPKVISTDPANNATGVVLNKTVTATFSMAMNPLTINTGTFTISHGTTPVSGIVSYLGTTASFKPTIDLLQGTTYTCTITTGAGNLAGIPLANNYVWTFTTISVAAPLVISTDPANNAIGVVLNKTVTATFNMAMNPLTINSGTFTISHGTTPVAGIVSYVGATASFIPSASLLPGAIYTCTITTGAANVAGIPLANNYVWTFTTVSVAAPLVISTDPANNATGVVLNKTVTATFNMAMNPLTINTGTFTIFQGTTPVVGIVSYLGTTASFIPSASLLPGAIYTCTITTGAANVAGIPLANNYVWTFTTVSVAAPLVISTDPANNATGVALNKIVAATFNMPMDPLTLNTGTFTLFHGTTQVAGLVTYAGVIASFAPSAALLSNTLYTATITNGAKNLAGIPLASNYIWNFTTQGGVIVPLGSASIFGAFGGNAGVTNQGIFTVINGSIGTTAASTLVTGFHDGLTGDVYTETPLNVGLVTNGIFTAPPFPGTATSFAIATQGLIDATIAYNSISPASKPGGIDPGAGELGGLTLAPGIYKSASGTFKISNGNLTLDAQGNPNATWIFQTAAGLTVGIAGPTGARSIVMINEALPKNVFWYVGSAATINGAGGGIMVGTIIANSGVTFSTAGNTVLTVLNGRAISLIASVTVVNTIINVPLP